MVVVAISGQPGCGSSTTGRLLAQRLGVKFFSVGKWNKEQLHIIAGRSTRSETQDSIEMWKNARGKSSDFHNDADMMQKELASKGNIVIDGKLAIHMLRGFCDFSVWLRADFETRVKRYAHRDSTGLKEAQAALREKEGLEKENFLKIYGFDYFGQEHEADIVVDTGDNAPEEIVDMILKKMKAKKII